MSAIRPQIRHKPGYCRLWLLLWLLLPLMACTPNRVAYEQAMKEQSGTPQDELGFFRQETLPPGYKPEAESEEADLWEIMDKLENRLRLSGETIQDTEMQDYLQELVCRLSASHCPNIRIYLVHRPLFNATMAPNGMMEIWSGLFLRVRTEAQLAAILGHEMGHYLRRHALQRFHTKRAKNTIMTMLSVASGFAGVPFAADLVDVAATGGLLAYERDQEREADGYGVRLLQDAGYDPREAAVIWRLVAELNALDNDDLRKPSALFATHPVSDERGQELEQLAERVHENRPEYGERGRDRYQRMLLPRRAALLRDEVALRNSKSSLKLLERLQEDNLNTPELHYFRGEVYRVMGGSTNGKLALEAYRHALEGGYSQAQLLPAMAAAMLQAQGVRRLYHGATHDERRGDD